MDEQANRKDPLSPTILIVDDHDQVRAALRAWLTAVFPDYEYKDADCGESAIILAASQPPHLVLMDIGLPGINGIEAARRIKAATPQTKVVMLSIHEEQNYRYEAKTAGANGFVTKSKMRLELIPLLKTMLPEREQKP